MHGNLGEGAPPAAAALDTSPLPPFTLTERILWLLCRQTPDYGTLVRVRSILVRHRFQLPALLGDRRDRAEVAAVIEASRVRLLVDLTEAIEGPAFARMVEAEYSAGVEPVAEGGAL